MSGFNRDKEMDINAADLRCEQVKDKLVSLTLYADDVYMQTLLDQIEEILDQARNDFDAGVRAGWWKLRGVKDEVEESD